MKTYISKTKAKTNVFNIKSSISDAIINILMNHSNNIQCGVCDVPYENKDSKSDYYKKVDKKIKSCINLELSLKKDEKIKYTKISLGNKSFLYFYLSTKNKKI